MPTPPLPRRVRNVRLIQRLSPAGKGFLTLFRLVVRNEYEDGGLSRPYRVEMVERRGVDSVALIPHLRSGGKIWIVAKAGFRPPLFLRHRKPGPADPRAPRVLTVEAVAGSLEPGDLTEEAIDRRALAELEEETGFRAPARNLRRLGEGFFPSHGQCTEKVHLRSIRLSARRRGPAHGDGSVNEAQTWTLMFEATDLLRRCRRGEVEDPKLEIGVVRLLEALRFPGSR